jgi:hypothetical protein
MESIRIVKPSPFQYQSIQNAAPSNDDQSRAYYNEVFRLTNEKQTRNNYVALLYQSAHRMFFLALLFVVLSGLSTIYFIGRSKTNEEIITALRSDPELIKLLKGPMGDLRGF